MLRLGRIFVNTFQQTKKLKTSNLKSISLQKYISNIHALSLNKIMALNVNGMEDLRKRTMIIENLKNQKCDIITLIDTRLSKTEQNNIKKMKNIPPTFLAMEKEE